jgi:uncharacterized membrane protein
MVIAASLMKQIWVVICGIASAFANVAFTGSLLLSAAMAAGVVLYAKRRPKGASLTWGQAMLAAIYVSFLLFFFFGVVPDRWMVYASGELGMRSDSVLAGPGSTGWLKALPVVITKATVADIGTTIIYGVGLVTTTKIWALWQKRGEGVKEEVETSTYGRPLVKS